MASNALTPDALVCVELASHTVQCLLYETRKLTRCLGQLRMFRSVAFVRTNFRNKHFMKTRENTISTKQNRACLKKINLSEDGRRAVRAAQRPFAAHAASATQGIRTRRTRNLSRLVREAVSKPNFPSKYALESSRRDLHNALLCTALHRFSLISNFSLKIAECFAVFFQN